LSLFYRTDSMSQYSVLEMNDLGSGKFSQPIDFLQYSGKVEYYFRLSTPYYQYIAPASAPAHPFQFRIGKDNSPPQFYHQPLADVFIQPFARDVDVFVEDNVKVDSNSVQLFFEINGTHGSLTMDSGSGNWFHGQIPASGQPGDSVVYYFSAKDLASPPNEELSQKYRYRIGVENFDRDLTFWSVDSVGWQLDDLEFRSPPYSVSTFPGGAYPNNANVSLTLKFGLKREHLNGKWLSFYTRYEIEAEKDFGFVEFSQNGAMDWQSYSAPFTGTRDQWSQQYFSLNRFYEHGSGDSLLIRFRLQTDSTQQKPMAGWFVDDIEISDQPPVTVSDKQPVLDVQHPEIAIVSIAPNPFNSMVRIIVESSAPMATRVEIFNLLGQRIVEQRLEFLTAGRREFYWDGLDQYQRQCGSGIYLFRLSRIVSRKTDEVFSSKTVKLIHLR
ncbi:MAG: hypothetical protein SCK70_14890, partial [bacterium]|nr:hypothetical protein [bacterium]